MNQQLKIGKLAAVFLCSLFLSLIPVFPANSGIICCQNAWECAATIATGGTSCALDLAFEAVRNSIDSLIRLRSSHVKEYEGMVTELEPGLREALKDAADSSHSAVETAKRAADSARKIVGDDYTAMTRIRETTPSVASAVVASPTPAKSALSRIKTSGVEKTSPTATSLTRLPDSSTVDYVIQSDAHDWMKQQAQLVEENAGQALIAEKSTNSKIHQAEALYSSAQAKTRTVFVDRFLRPVDELLRLLKYALSLNNPLEIYKFASQMVTVVDSVVSAYEQEVRKSVDVMDKDLQTAVHLPDEDVKQAWVFADKAAAILARMQRVQKLTTLAERQAAPLQIITGGAPGTVPAKSMMRLSQATASFLPVAKNAVTKLSALRPDLVRLGQPTPVDLAPFRARLAADLDARIAGKTPGAAKLALDNLLAESRRRFASDPKTLHAVETLLRNESRARGMK